MNVVQPTAGPFANGPYLLVPVPISSHFESPLRSDG